MNSVHFLSLCFLCAHVCGIFLKECFLAAIEVPPSCLINSGCLGGELNVYLEREWIIHLSSVPHYLVKPGATEKIFKPL